MPEREVWQPANVAAVVLNDVEQGSRLTDPLERIDQRDRVATQHGKQEGRKQPHVVIERQPARNAHPATGRIPDQRPVSVVLPQQGSTGNLYRLLDAGRTRTVLDENRLVVVEGGHERLKSICMACSVAGR